MTAKRIRLALAFSAASGLALTPLAFQAEAANKVTLQKRVDNGPYKTSAYSIRYATQDAALHRNHVDLVYDTCGCIHVAAESGSKNRIAKTKAKTLRDVKELPKDGWQECILPEKGSTYVLDIDNDDVKMRAKLLLTEVTDKSVKLEWSLLGPAAEAGTKGQCGGPHEAK